MVRRKAAWLLAALSLLLTLSGCWDRTAMEDSAYIISMGVDRAGAEYLWTFRIMSAERLSIGMLSPGGGSQSLAAGLVSSRAPTLVQALQNLQAGMTRVISLSHVRNVVIGREVAEKGVETLLSQLLRHNEMRLSAGAMVAEGRAVDVLLRFAPQGETNAAKAIEGLQLVMKRFHLAPPMRLKHFHSRLISRGGDPILPLVAVNPLAEEPPGAPLPHRAARNLTAGEIPRAGGNPVELAGTAVFRGDRMVGTLNIQETASLLALRGQMGKAYGTLPDLLSEGHVVTIRYGQENKPKITAALMGGRPVFHIKLQIDGELLSTTGEVPYSFREQRRKLEKALARQVDQQTLGPLVQKIYNEWGADPVGLGNRFRTRFGTYDDWLAFGWRDRIREAKVTVESELFIRRFGLALDQQGGLEGDQ